MKTLKKVTFALLATTALIGTGYANAQASDATTDSAPPTSKKAARAHNHQLEKTVRRALTHTKGLDAAGVTVVARGSVVTLDGTVPSDDQIQTAADAAGGVSGVSSVTNNLVVREAGH